MRGVLAGVLCVVLALASAASSAQGQPAEIEQARSLIQAGRAEEAWQLLAPLQARYAGEPDFDLALAMAATDSGRPNLATFALERLVVVQPGNAAARLELARAYYALRDYERTERELSFIMEGDPPAAVRALVADYRSRMQGLAGASPAGWSGYAEAGIGHDTNANAATAQASVFVPGLGGDLLLDPSALRDADKFAALAAGAHYVRPLGAGWALIASGDLQLRRYAEQDEFDWRTLDLRAGLQQRLGHDQNLSYTLHHGDFELDRDGYRRMHSAAVQWAGRFGERARLNASAQGIRIRYRRDDVRELSSDMLVLGAGGAYAFPWAVASAGVLAGSDDAVSGRPDGDRRLYGASAGLQRRLAERLEAYGAFSLLQSVYLEENPQFVRKRRDRQYDAAIGLSWQVARGWFLRPQLSRTRNRSNIELHDYARTEASLALRRAWD